MIGLLWVFFEKVGLTLLSLFATFWYAKILGPTGFGEAAIILSVSLLFSGIQDYIQQFPLIASTDKTPNSFVTSLKGWLLVSFIISTLLFFILIIFFGWDYWLLILLSVLHIPISSVSKVFVADLVRKQAFKELAMRAFLGKLIGVCSGLILAYFGYAALAIIFQSFIALFVALFILIKFSEVFANHHIRFTFLDIDWHTFKALLKEGIPSGINVLEQSVKSHGLIILLGFLIGPYASGIYSLAIKFVDIPRTLIGYGFSSWATGKFYAVKEDQIKLIEVYKTSFFLGMMVLFPCYIGLVALSDNLVTTFFDSQWLGASDIISYLAIYNLIMSLFLFLPPLQVLFKTTYNTLNITLLSTFFMIVFVSLTTNIFDYYSPIIGMFLSLLILIPKFIKELNMILKIPYFSSFKLIIGCFIGCLCMLLSIVYAKYSFEMDNLFVLIPFGAISYLLSLLCLTYFKVINIGSFKSILKV